MRTFGNLFTLTLIVATLLSATLVQAQGIRIISVDPLTDEISITNYGGTTVDISSYRFCSLFAYTNLGISAATTLISGTYNLPPGDTVVMTGFALNNIGADLGLYLPTGSFASASVMVDFTQWGSGGNGRESVAVAKGIWNTGGFVSGTPPFVYTGDGVQNGVGFWSMVLTVYINEIHYDNSGSDVGEGVEIAGPAGTDLACWSLLFYNGSDSLEDPALALSGIIPDLGCGFGTIWFPKSGIQNGPADIIGLNNTCNSVVEQFLSYEGVIMANDGPAIGMTSIDIGVSEPTSTPVGESLQLIGTGTQYSDFTWSGPISATPNQFNGGQIFCPGDTTIAFVGSSASVKEDTGTFTIELAIMNTSPTTAFTVDVVYSTGSATITSDFTFTTQTITFPANDSTNKTATITIIDDAIPENSENIVLVLQNPSAGITLGSDSIFTITIKGNDIVIPSCSDLFFSEYVEGSSNNKALEIFNPRADTVNLADYLFLRRNGGSTTVNSFVFSGMLAPNDVFVVVNSGADSLNLLILGDTASTLTFFNGDDALAIVNSLSGDTIDKFGEWGVDPGINWPVDTGATSEFTLVRKASIQQGNLYWDTGAGEWDVFAQNDFSHIGSHTMISCAGAAAAANFSSDSTTCLTSSICFTDLSTTGQGAIISWGWDFGDGAGTSTSQNPCYTYSALGTYTVTLIVSDDSSNVDTTTATITVTAPATVNAGIDQVVCANITTCIQLSGSVTGVSTTGVWTTLGSGTFSPSDSDLSACYTPSAADTASGNVCLILTSTNNGTCTAVTDTVCLSFTPQPTLTASSSTIDSSSCGNIDGNITGIVAAGTAPLVFDWVDASSVSVGTALDLLLVGSGCYTLTLTDGNGCAVSSGPHCVLDSGAPGVPTAAGGATYCAGDAIADLTATGGGGTLFWFSDAALTDTLGSGSPFNTGATTTDSFYVAELGACLGPASQVIITVNMAPTANAGADMTVCNADTVSLAGSIGGSASSSTWTTTGDGLFDNSTLLNASYTSGTNDVAGGMVVLILTSDDPAGPCPSAVDSITVTIDQLATASAGADATVCSGEALTLSGMIGGSASSSTWTSSGDGTFDDATQLTAVYTPGSADATSGSVTLTLTSDDPAGSCFAASDDMVLAVATKPVAGFTSLEALLSVDFADASTISSGSITFWNWDFGDGNSSGSQNPSNTYAAEGAYYVCLTVVSSDGCSDTLCDSVAVLSVGITELDLSRFVEVYPNPSADGMVNVKVASGDFRDANLQVLDPYGKLIAQRTLSNKGVETLDLSSQAAGIYFIHIVSEQGTVTKRITLF